MSGGKSAEQRKRCEEWIEAQLATAPPLRPEQVDNLRALLRVDELSSSTGRRHPGDKG